MADNFWCSYQDIYNDVGKVYSQLCEQDRKIVTIAIGRGGWVAARILAAFFEQDHREMAMFTITPTYVNRNSEREKVELVQGLDGNSIRKIKKYVGDGYEICLFDAPFVTGGTMNFAAKYVEGLFDVEPKIVVLHWVEYKKIESAPWREPPTIKPDIFARKFSSDGQSWYVQYPWEWSSLKKYDALSESG
jgi:hypoxanthine phosphoribosyltransferase